MPRRGIKVWWSTQLELQHAISEAPLGWGPLFGALVLGGGAAVVLGVGSLVDGDPQTDPLIGVPMAVVGGGAVTRYLRSIVRRIDAERQSEEDRGK